MKPTELTDAMVDQILEGLDESKLGEWEQGFLTSVRNWWKQKRKLSDKQKKRLSELWEKQHDPKAKRA
jgi:hypothetical protein